MLHQEEENIFFYTYERNSFERSKKSKCMLLYLTDMFILNRGTKIKPNRVTFWDYNKSDFKKPYEKFQDQDRKGKCFLFEKEVKLENNKNVQMVFEIEVNLILI